MYSIMTNTPTETISLIIGHFATYGIEMTSITCVDGVLKIETDAPLDAELITHLELTEI